MGRPTHVLVLAVSLGVCVVSLLNSHSSSSSSRTAIIPTSATATAPSSQKNAPPCSDVSKLRETCLDPEGPQPYVLMTLGRSGSGSTWQVIGNLTGYETPSNEYTGSGPAKSENFFQRNSGADNDRWLLRYLCSKQLTYPEASVVGFKWKPFDTIFSPPAKAAFRRMASLKRPEIKVVRSRRNLLDVVISKYKHSIYDGKVAAAHCRKGDQKCIEKGRKASTGLELPIDKLLDTLREYNTLENKVDELLKKMKIPHVQVTYERLYYNGDDTSEWRKIFKFLGVGPFHSKDLTRRHLEGAMEHVATSIPMQNVTLKNFDAVSKVLKGTEFEKLLH